MIEWIVSSSVLIAVIILLRSILKGKISLRLQYALWGLVLIRLLLPVSLGNSDISIMNQVENSQIYQDVMEPEVNSPMTNAPDTSIPSQSASEPNVPSSPNTEAPPVVIPDSGASSEGSGQIEQTGQTAPSLPETPPAQEMPSQSGNRFDWVTVLRLVWIGGIVLLGAWLLVTNLLFAAGLHKSRTALAKAYKLPVYVCDKLDTPCLFGFLRPAIYLTNEVAADERTMRHAVEHELTHFRHGDHIWALLRGICLAVHWYNPLVWCAAILSRNDAELACDESTIRRLGESERAEYGKTLIRLTCEKRTTLLNTATTMTGSAKVIRERIALIVKQPKMALYTLVTVVIIAVIAIVCTFTGAKDSPHSFAEWTESLTTEDIQLAEVAKEYGTEKFAYTISKEEYDELCAILTAITEHNCSLTKPEGDNEDGYRLVLYRADKLWLFKCLDDGTVGLMFNDSETGAYFGCEGSLLIIESPALWEYIVSTVDEKGSKNSDDENEDKSNTGENEEVVDEFLSYVLHRLETLRPEDIKSYSDNMQADAKVIVPLIHAAAKTYTTDYVMDNHGEWSVDLHLSEHHDDPYHSPEGFTFAIDTREGIVDVHYRAGTEADPSDYLDLRLNSLDLWNYIFSLYNPGGIDQAAMAKFEDILSARAQQTMEYHNTTKIERGYPAFTGFEIDFLRLIDSFSYEGYDYQIYRWDAGFLTDDPDPDRYAWYQDQYVDDQNRICNYEWCRYFVAAWRHDDLEYEFFNDDLYNGSQLRTHAIITEHFTGKEIYLEGEPVYQEGTPIISISSLYTCQGVSIEVPNNLHHLVDAHKNLDTWCDGMVMNPTYYHNNPSMTEQTLFSLFHTCEYWENGGGLIFSIRRYTEEEYRTMYLNSYSRQSVFARDENYYYCVFIPTGATSEDPETAAILAALLDQQLSKILPDMIERNGWQVYNGEESNTVQISVRDASVVPEEYREIIAARAEETVTQHNAVCEEREQPFFTGYEVLSFELVDNFTRNGDEYLIYNWDVVFPTNDPNADNGMWAGSPFADEQYRIHLYEQYTNFVVYKKDGQTEYGFFHNQLFADPQSRAYAQIIQHFTSEELELTGTQVSNGTVYTRDGIAILIPFGWCSMPSPSKHTDSSGGGCCEILVNPTFYADLSDQTLFSLYHANEYWMDGLGWIFSIQRYTEDEYGPLYLDSNSRQTVFAKDDNYYYCVLIPTDAQFSYSYMETLRDRVLDDILDDMIPQNGWERYNG